MTKPRSSAAAAVAALLLLAPAASAVVSINGPGGKLFDIQDSSGGQLTQGTSDAYDSCYYLWINTTQYNAAVAGTPILAGRGVQMAAVTMGNLLVQRTAWVPATGLYDYIRYYDTVENTSTGTETVTVSYKGNLGSDSSTQVTATQSGDTLVDATDRWYCTDDSSTSSGDPSLAHLFFGENALEVPTVQSLSTDNLTTTFQVDIPPGGKAAFIMFGVQANDAAAAAAAAAFITEFPDDTQEGLESEQLFDLVNWAAVGAPRVAFVDEELTVEEGGSVDIAVTVEDPEGDTVTTTWDLDEDDAFDDATGTTATYSAQGIDGPSTKTVAVKVSDGTNERIREKTIEVTNVVPVFTSTPGEGDALELHRGDEWTYQIAVDDQANTGVPPESPLDRLSVTVLEKPQGMIYAAGMTLAWTVPRSDEIVGDHAVRLQCVDGDGGTALQEFTLTVLENSPPGRPTIVSPKEQTVATARPTMTIANTTDPDGDRISYVFQVATAGTFAAETIFDYATVSENPAGQTSWTVNKDLAQGTRYYWRVWAQDDKEKGPAVSTFFDVDLTAGEEDASGEAVEASDAATDARPEFQESDGGSCSCTLAGAGFPGGALTGGVALFLLGLVALRRFGRKRDGR